MAIPDFQTLMLPLLKLYSDGKEHDRNEVLTKLGVEFCLSDAEMAEMLPSGRQGRFDNRVAWSKSYLKQAGIFESAGYSKEARAYAGQVNAKLVLIDGPMLAELMIDYGLGVSTVTSYKIKRVDSDYFAAD